MSCKAVHISTNNANGNASSDTPLENVMIYIALVAISAFFTYIILKIQRNRKYRYPPGPSGIPIFGSLFEGNVKYPHKFFSELRKEYGDIVTVRMPGESIVVLNSLEAINKCFNSKELSSVCSGRPVMIQTKYIDGGKALTSMDYSETWVKLRKVIHKCLHMYGEGIHDMEEATRHELKHVVEWVANQEGKPFSPEDVIVPSSLNNIYILIMGKRLEYDDPAFLAIREFITKGIKVVSTEVNSTIMAFPFLRFLPFSYGKLFQDGMKSLDKVIYYTYEKPKQSYDPTVCRGLLDELLKYQEHAREQHGHCWLDDDMIKMNVKELLVAGSVTTRGALTSFFLIIQHKPEVAEKIKAEIDEVIGHTDPSLEHKPHMSYTEATIWELLRYISHTPVAVPHCTTADVKIRDYFIPKGTMLVSNVWEVHHDETLWEKPWEFRPERFLDDKGNFVDAGDQKRRNMIAFGVGKRSCPGELFARSRIFLFITTVLQRFNLRPAKGEQLSSADPRNFEEGAVIRPVPYRLQATGRDI